MKTMPKGGPPLVATNSAGEIKAQLLGRTMRQIQELKVALPNTSSWLTGYCMPLVWLPPSVGQAVISEEDTVNSGGITKSHIQITNMKMFCFLPVQV